MALFSSTQPSLRARILPRFPARVVAGSGMTIAKSGGTYTFTATPSIPPSVQVDKGTVNSGTVTFVVSAGTKQKLTVGGALTIAFSDWPTSGTYGEVEIQLVNGGIGVTWPGAIKWLIGDGTNSTTFGDMGVTLQNAATNWVLVWSTDNGTSIYGRAI